MPATNSDSTTRQVGKMTLTVRSDREVELRRVFDAPRRLVWEALSKPEHIPHWWGLRAHTMTSCRMDFRPGGSWRFVTRDADGNEYAFRGEYRQIVPGERIVQTFEFEGMPGQVSVETMTLEERDGRTTLTVLGAVDSVEERDGMLQSGMADGAAETYDRLEEYLGTIG
jgi:uncharacterized protein YndB with AHSA1/START domain